MKSSIEFDKAIENVIPGHFYMISSSEDHQQSEEAHNTTSFELPNPAGKHGGACTSSFLQQQYENTTNDWMEMLVQMRNVLKGKGFAQTPCLSTSRPIDVKNCPMFICPPNSGRRRALLIGINYTGQVGALTACQNDCRNLQEYLENVHGFRQAEILTLMDDGIHAAPTKENIENGMMLLTQYSQPGDVVFVSFSGHGGQAVDLDGDEDDGMDETYV